MTRHELRILTFKAIFEIEFNPIEEMEEKVSLLLENCDSELKGFEAEITDADAELIKNRVASVFAHLDEINDNISKKADGWSINRMGKAELAIIRLAMYEMYYDDSVPVGVAINEAVEIAKEFCDENAYTFVNGVLSKLAPNAE